MKSKRQDFHFLGFVALADTLFAVSAGLLLLNPIRFESKSAEASPTVGETELQPQMMRTIAIQIEQLESRVDQLEKEGQHLQRRTVEVLQNE